MFASPAVHTRRSTAPPAVQTRRSALVSQLRRIHCGIRQFFSRDLTVQRDEHHPCWKEAHFLPCTRPPDVDLLKLRSYFLSQLGPRYVRICSSFPCTRRATSSLLQDFSPPSSKGCSSGGHFLFLPLLVLSLSYCPYSGEHFLLWVLYSSLSL